MENRADDTCIPLAEMEFHPISFGDPGGRVFWWKGQLCRGIHPERSQFYQDLFAQGTISDLVKRKLLIETSETDWTTKEFGLVLQHRVIPVVSYAPEWCASMLRAAALCVLDLELALGEHNLTLQDAHPGNVLFEGTKPCYVDFASIVPLTADGDWPAYDEFCRFFVYPLLLCSAGHSRVARWLLHDYDKGVLATEVDRFGRSAFSRRPLWQHLRLAAKKCTPRLLHPLLGHSWRRCSLRKKNLAAKSADRLADLRRLRKRVEQIPISMPRTAWSEYYEDCFPPFTPSAQWTPKHDSFLRIITELRPRTLLDVGSNRGWFSQLAARLGVQVIASDVDDPSLNKLFRDASAESLPILPIFMDIRSPEPAYGLTYEWFAPATERFRSDMVLALAVVHHLVFTQKLNFGQIAKALSAFCKRWLVVEFIGPADRYVREWNPERYPWYHLDAFLAALGKQYARIRQFPSNLEH